MMKEEAKEEQRISPGDLIDFRPGYRRNVRIYCFVVDVYFDSNLERRMLSIIKPDGTLINVSLLALEFYGKKIPLL